MKMGTLILGLAIGSVAGVILGKKLTESKTNDQIEPLKNLISRLKSENDKLLRRSNEDQKDIDNYTSEIKSLKDRLYEKEDLASDTYDDLNLLKTKYQRLQNENNELKLNLQKLQVLYNELTK